MCLEADGRGCTPILLTLAQIYGVLQSHHLCLASSTILGTSTVIFVHSTVIFGTVHKNYEILHNLDTDGPVWYAG